MNKMMMMMMKLIIACLFLFFCELASTSSAAFVATLGAHHHDGLQRTKPRFYHTFRILRGMRRTKLAFPTVTTKLLLSNDAADEEKNEKAREEEEVPPMSVLRLECSFPNVPYELGLRHIHTPEHIFSTHALGVPGFTLSNVSRPFALRFRENNHHHHHMHNIIHNNNNNNDMRGVTRTKEWVGVRFSCGTRLLGGLVVTASNVTMISPRRQEVRLCFFNHGTLTHTLHFSVAVHENGVGHLLRVRATVFARLNMAQKGLLLLGMWVNVAEDVVFWSYESPQIRNLRLYRQRALFSS